MSSQTQSAPGFGPAEDDTPAGFGPAEDAAPAPKTAPGNPQHGMRALTQRERFEMRYPVGNKGERVGENIKNTAQNMGVGIWKTIAHPIDTVTSMVKSVIPGTDTPNPLKSTYDMLNTGDYPAMSQAAGQAMVLGEAGRAVKAVAPRVIRGTADAVAGTGPRATKALVKETTDANAADATDAAKQNKLAANKYQTDAALAKHENTGREASYAQDLRTEAEKIRNKDSGDAAKLKADHEKELSDARDHNARVTAKHAEAVKRIQGENAAGESTLQMRQQKATELQNATRDYYAKENAVAAKSKAAENSAWQRWRGKMKNATVDGGSIAGQLKKLAQTSPEVERMLHQLEPQGDEVPPDSNYAQMRDRLGGKPYAELPPDEQQYVDEQLSRAGAEPDTIEFDPQEGKPVNVDQIQRTNSILQRYIRSGRFEGPLLGEMKQVAKVLRNSISEASESRGALGDLESARAETIRHNEAFGRERPEPRTVKGEREKWSNPEEKKAVQEQERIDAAAKIDPSLAEAASKVRAARDELKKLPSEDQLRKGQKQVPRPPSLNDLREGYRLKPEPSAPAPRLTSGSAEERATQVTNQPERVPTPPRPPERLPAPRKINAEDVQAAKAKGLEGREKFVNQRVMWVAVTPLLYSIDALVRGQGLHLGDVAAGMGSMLTAGKMVTKLMENTKFVDFITKATPRDVDAIPPNLRGSFPNVVKAAQAKGIKVSPALLGIAAVSGLPAPRAQNPTDAYATPQQ
jgi:hypothetical protein